MNHRSRWVSIKPHIPRLNILRQYDYPLVIQKNLFHLPGLQMILTAQKYKPITVTFVFWSADWGQFLDNNRISLAGSQDK